MLRTVLPPCLRAGPFTSAQARAVGVSDRALQGPSVRRLYDGVYLAADLEPTLQQRVLAALLVLPRGSALGGVSALQLLGLDVGLREPLCFWTDHEHQIRRPGLRVTRVIRLPPVTGHMLPGAALFRTAAPTLGLLDLVAAGDFLLRNRYATVEQLREIADTGCRGRVLSRRAAALARDLVDSPQETRLRLALTLAGLPEPDVNVELRVNGRLLGTPDLSYRRWRTVLEYEGDQHRSDPKQWSYDVRRYERMAAAGHTVIRITAEDWREPRALVNRVHAALVARGFRGPTPVFDDAWTELFESSAR